MPADLTYSRSAFGYRVYAETPAGERAWRELFEANGASDFVTLADWPKVTAAARRAGLSLRKARPVAISDSELLAALET